MGTPPIRMGTTQHVRPPAGAKKGARPVVSIGGATRPLPLLTGAVGRPPALNAPVDCALVDAALASIAALRPAAAPGKVPPALLAVAEAVRGFTGDRATAIAAFQRVEDIRDADQSNGVVSPDSLSWEALFTWGELARDLETVRDRKVKPADYTHSGGFDAAVFETTASAQFKKSKADGGRYNAASIAGMKDLLGRCARDPRIVDIRWIAYLMATAMWESYGKGSMPTADGKGTQSVMRWASPSEEGGKGLLRKGVAKRYYLPVKVAAAPGGGATVTEQDGDTFHVAVSGAVSSQSKGAAVGAAPFAAAAANYATATGAENAYFGRGYCQLTWWNNYATTGAEIGLGLELLLHPERALEPDIAYEVMAHCMVHGTGFANRKRLQMYLSGAKKDYVGARAMVNGVNENVAIAAVAEVFEQALLAARL